MRVVMMHSGNFIFACTTIVVQADYFHPLSCEPQMYNDHNSMITTAITIQVGRNDSDRLGVAKVSEFKRNLSY